MYEGEEEHLHYIDYEAEYSASAILSSNVLLHKAVETLVLVNVMYYCLKKETQINKLSVFIFF